MKLVVMGTGPFAVPSAEQLRKLGHDICLVVTRPVMATHGKPPPTPVLDWANTNQLPIFQPASINDPASIQRLREMQADLFFVCDYGQILSRDCLSTSRLGGINLHGSILPRHRGAAPVQWSILRGDPLAGVSVIHMTPKLDSGPVLTTAQTSILPDETAAQLEPRLAELGIQATQDAIDMLESWDGVRSLGTSQDAELATKAPRFTKADGQLDFRLPAEVLVRFVRALQPWPSTFADLLGPDGKSSRLNIRAARFVEDVSDSHDRSLGATWVVTAEQLNRQWVAPWNRMLAVQCAPGILLVGRLQPGGKREMTADEFLRGHALSASSWFALPEIPSRFTHLFGLHS